MTYPQEKPYRNLALTLRVLRGETATALASHYGLNRRRIAQIAHHTCRKVAPELYDEVAEPGSLNLAPLVASAGRFVERIGGRESETA